MVLTIMSRDRAAQWQGSARLAVGNALLSADNTGMTAAEMGFIAQQHQSNLKKAAEDLVSEGVLRYVDPPSEDGPRRGRRPRTAFTFGDGERERFEELAAEERPIGLLGVGGQVVMVDAQENPERLSEVLSRDDLLGHLAWAAHVDGERSEVWLAYEGQGASENSRDLMTAFTVAELSARRSSVAKLMNARELARVEDRKRHQAESLRAQLQTGQPSRTRSA